MPTLAGLASRHWFLITLAIVLTIGLGGGPTLAPWARAFPRWALVAAILFVTALPVDLKRMASTGDVPLAIALATLLNAVAAPLLGYAASLALPTGLGIGLFAAGVSPCTMASAAVWTRRGGGNDAVALAVTMITSLGCFVVLPGWTWLLLGENVGVEPTKLMLTLLACVAAPVALAQFGRRWPLVAASASAAKPALSVAGQLGVLGIVLLGAANAGHELHRLATPIPASTWVAVGASALAVHVTLLVAGWAAAERSGLARPEGVAVAIAGSQKTLAVGVGVAAEFGPLALLPMIAYHAVQLVVDTLFVDRLRGSGRAGDALEPPPPPP